MSTTENVPEDPFADFQWKNSEVSEMRKGIEKWKPAQTATRRTIEKNLVEVFLQRRGLDTPFLAGFVQKKCSLWFSNHTADRQEGTPDWCGLRLFTGRGLWYSKHFKDVEEKAGKDASFGMKNSQAAEMWKKLDEEEQEEWLDLAAEYNTKPPPPDFQREYGCVCNYANKNMVHIVEEFIKFMFRVCGAAVFVYTTRPAIGGQYMETADALQKHQLWDTNTKVACLETFSRLLGMIGDADPPALRDQNLFRRQRRDRSSTVAFKHMYGLPQPFHSSHNGKKMTSKEVYAHGCDFFRLHLSLATGDGVLLNSVPWSTIKPELEKYIPEDYLTSEFKDKFDCMSKMSIKAQNNWFQYILQTEASLPAPEDYAEPGPGEVFQVPEGRFHLLRGLHKPTADHIPGQYRALYVDDVTESVSGNGAEAGPSKKSRRGGKSKRNTDGEYSTGKRTSRKRGKTAKRKGKGKGKGPSSDDEENDNFFENEADKEDREEDEFEELQSGDGDHDESGDDTDSDKEGRKNEEEDEDGDGDEVRSRSRTPALTRHPLLRRKTMTAQGLRSPVVRRTTVLPAERPAPYGVKPGGVVPFLESLCAETQYQNLLTRVAKALETKVDIPPIPAAPWATWANVHGFVGHDLYNDAQEVVRLLDWIGDQSDLLGVRTPRPRLPSSERLPRRVPPPEFDSGDDFGQSALTLLRCGAGNLLKGSFPERMNVLCDMMELTLEAGWKPKRTGPMPRPVKKKGKAADNGAGPSSSTLPGNGTTDETEGTTGTKVAGAAPKQLQQPPVYPGHCRGARGGVKITSTPPTRAVDVPKQAPGGSSGNDTGARQRTTRQSILHFGHSMLDVFGQYNGYSARRIWDRVTETAQSEVCLVTVVANSDQEVVPQMEAILVAMIGGLPVPYNLQCNPGDRPGNVWGDMFVQEFRDLPVLRWSDDLHHRVEDSPTSYFQPNITEDATNRCSVMACQELEQGRPLTATASFNIRLDVTNLYIHWEEVGKNPCENDTVRIGDGSWDMDCRWNTGLSRQIHRKRLFQLVILLLRGYTAAQLQSQTCRQSLLHGVENEDVEITPWSTVVVRHECKKDDEHAMSLPTDYDNALSHLLSVAS
ncbi:uncharacterized protein BXZ73DRAFT_79165 [Epithele typhae]|uniref:uncharacterized protein n=1 Tax=Epithele typhae TaxID=378194 RepID=UPI002008BB80|nr:uncharacterized protein BXZ73DRAFT_79165 [Epithele typhae]KAH9925063.1 hypothetical protein BXZ73DRAFT_79165 [Epithele typhae]